MEIDSGRLWPTWHPSLPVEEFPIARHFREHVLGVPVHQGLTAPALDRIAEAVLDHEGASEVRAVLVTTAEDAEPYRERWDRLAVAEGAPYAAPGWMLAWWRHAAPRGARLRTVLVLDGDELVAVAPFFSDTRLGARRLRLLGAGVSGRLDVLGSPDDEGVVAGAIAEALAGTRPTVDAILFEGTPGSSPWPAALAAAWPSTRAPRLRRTLSMPAPGLDLAPDGFESWIGLRSSHFRSRMRRGLRKLEQGGGRIRLSEPGDFHADLVAFAELHAARWRPRGGSGVVTEGVERMLLEVAPRYGAEGRLRAWCIDVDGKTVSVQLFLAAGGEVTYWLGGFDERGPRMHPGPAILSLFKEVEHAHAAGDRHLDLGGGAQPYKYEFAEREDSLEWTCLLFPTLRAPLVRAALLPLSLRVSTAKHTPVRVKRLLRRGRGLLHTR